MNQFRYFSDENFRFNLIKGQIAKEAVRGLLEQAHYQVYPFGYESTISKLRSDVQQKRVPHSDSNDRVRSMPDLMVYDESKRETTFVEVKFRKTESAEQVKLNTIELNRISKFWNDCLVVVVIPIDHFFFCQWISKIRMFAEQKSHQYDLLKEFEPIEDHFPGTREHLARYRSILDQFKSVLKVEQEDEEQ